MARGPSGRNLTERLRTTRGRTGAQQRWLERQLNDPYVARARAEGYRSRAAYKLLDIDARYHLLKPGQRVIDLGAAPGGWCQVAAARVGAEAGKGRVVGLDLLDMPPIAGVTLIRMDFLADEAPAAIMAQLGGPADLVLSDMAANTTGHKKTDHLRTLGLVEAAAAFAAEVLAPGGAFLAKVLQGGTEGALLADLKRGFRTVHHVKPPSSRADSSELYVLATGFRAASSAAGDSPA